MPELPVELPDSRSTPGRYSGLIWTVNECTCLMYVYFVPLACSNASTDLRLAFWLPHFCILIFLVECHVHAQAMTKGVRDVSRTCAF